MPEKRTKKPSLPMVRLEIATPLIDDLRSRGIDIQKAMRDFSFKEDDFNDPELWIPAAKIYALVEHFAEVCHDPYYGVNAGEKLNPWDWPPMALAVRRSSNVGELLLRFMEDAQAATNSCTYILKSAGDRTTFRESRVSDGGLLPRHNDGYTITYLLAILRGAVGHQWDGSKVVAHVCDPDVIPPSYHGIRTAKTDTMGASVSFPTRWLLLALEGGSRGMPDDSDPAPSNPIPDIVSAFHHAVGHHIHEFDLDVQRMAAHCGLSKRTLARKLKRRGTSAGKELGKMRAQSASRQLRESDRDISEIAVSVGYADPVVFSRAFKRWTGVSPRQYRSKSRGN